jgi:hypothetical protein
MASEQTGMPPLKILADSLTNRGLGKIWINASAKTLWSDGAVEAMELGVPHVSRSCFHKGLKGSANDSERKSGELVVLGSTQNVFYHGKGSFAFCNGNRETRDVPGV